MHFEQPDESSSIEEIIGAILRTMITMSLTSQQEHELLNATIMQEILQEF